MYDRNEEVSKEQQNTIDIFEQILEKIKTHLKKAETKEALNQFQLDAHVDMMDIFYRKKDKGQLVSGVPPTLYPKLQTKFGKNRCLEITTEFRNINESWWLAEDVKGQVGYVPAAYLMIILDETQQEEESRKEGHDKRTDGTKIGGEMGQDGERRKSYSAAVIDGCERTSTIYVGDSIVRKTDRSLSKGKDVVVCLPGARIEHVTERVKKIMGRGNGGSIVVHVGTNNADKEGTTAILEKYRDLLKKTKQARVGQIIISGILPVFGNKIQGYRNSKRMAVNGMVERLCKEEDVGYMDLWDSFVGNEDMYVRDGLHLSGKGAAVFAEGLSGAVASGLGKVRYLN